MYPSLRSSGIPWASPHAVDVQVTAIISSVSADQSGGSRTLYGSTTIVRATVLSRMVWKSRSYARFDYPKLPWRMCIFLIV